MLATGQAGANSIAVGPSRVFWTTANGEVMRLAK
jgi:hypothetical protein